MGKGNTPAHLAMTGGKLPRQRMWEAIRSLSHGEKELSSYGVSRISGEDDEAVRDYLRSLAKASIVRQVQAGNRDAVWELLVDEGAEAPRVNRRGKRQPPDAVECIWRALRILGELTATTAAEQAHAGGAKISPEGAARYLQGLTLAGYVARAGGTPGNPASYRLLPGRYSGPLHPIYQRCTYEQVYDPNLDQVVWVKGQQPDPAELSGLRIEVERLRKLLTELKSARPLVLYGDAWIEQIEVALGERSEVPA